MTTRSDRNSGNSVRNAVYGPGEAQVPDGKLCYILDGILVIYGVLLTILYCRLRVRNYKPFFTNQKTYVYI
uniref:Uncharacterized protein n=1 Tax=Oncorhynchus mykiss TaxID=8022 RepID=A0A8K9XQG4_ONCMY